LRIADDTMAGAVKMMRDHLVKRYLDCAFRKNGTAVSLKDGQQFR
jgi:hypothetical protein